MATTEYAEAWMAAGNCVGIDPDLFFPERGASVKEAIAVCNGCAVREDCLDYAIETGTKHGIWGGLSERGRRRLRRQRVSAGASGGSAAAL